jgi:hypothetical protein
MAVGGAFGDSQGGVTRYSLSEVCGVRDAQDETAV